jgi:sialate O-acetylesterase
VGSCDFSHPLDKQTVGHRAALAALNLAYGFKEECSGPKPAGLILRGSRLKLAMDHAKGLRLNPDPLPPFEVAGRDGRFHPAQAQIEGGGLLLWSPLVKKPWAARYAWSDNPDAVLFNGVGLPAGPFSLHLDAPAFPQ